MRWLPALLSLLLLTAGEAGAAGFREARAPDPGGRPIPIAIWYPSDARAPAEPNTPFRQALARDGAIRGERLPLVLLSHGKGGWLGAHAGTALALAEAGFVAVALTHPGDNRDDESDPAARWMVERPRQLGRVLDYLLGTFEERARLDAGRIGAFGFSAGGYTVLIAVGGGPDPALAAAHCAREPAEIACRLGMGAALQARADQDPAAFRNPDRRIRAAVLAAPALGFAFDQRALAEVRAPVQIWGGSDDRNVPHATNTQRLAEALPRPPDFHLVEAAGHFAFLPPCDPQLRQAQPELWAAVCVDAPGLDRAAFHRHLDAEVVAFFRRELSAR